MTLLERYDLQKIRTKKLSDFSATELAALLIQKYPSKPFTHLRVLWFNKDIGQRLYIQTKIILEGAGYDTTENDVKDLSIKDRLRGRSYEVRSTNT